MKMVIGPATAVLLLGLGQMILADPPGKELPAMERKILGAWKGQSGCAGNFLFRADGTYTLTEYGPAPYDTAGTWKLRGDALLARLVLTCKTSEIPDEVGKTTDVKLIRLDDESLAVKHGSQTVDRYARVKK